MLDSTRMTEVSAPVRIEVMTLGEAWIAIAAAILTDGVVGSWEGLPIVEVFRATLDVSSPRVDDPIIAQHGDPERVAWMHANFTEHSQVAELGDADSSRGPRPDPLGDRPTSRQSMDARRHDHDVPAIN